jgi:hypothetical protein
MRQLSVFALLAVLALFTVSFALAQEAAISPVRGWQKIWEFVLPSSTVSADMVDFGGEDGVRLVTLHSVPAKEDTLNLRLWKRAGDSWREEWQTSLEPGELRGMAAGYFAKGSKVGQILTPRQLILRQGEKHLIRTRKEEVNWFGYAALHNGEDIPLAAYPGGLWRGTLDISAREGWLRFERMRTDSLLSLPQQVGNADWVSFASSLAFRDMDVRDWELQGYEYLFGQLGKSMHPEQPLLVSRRDSTGKQSVAMVVPPSLTAPVKILWQSEPLEGEVREVRLVSVARWRGGLLVLLGKADTYRVQFWAIQR